MTGPAGPGMPDRGRQAAGAAGKEGKMANWRCSALVICPYYLRENERQVVCEGMKEGVEMMLRFASLQEKVTHQHQVCCTWEYRSACPYAALLEARYQCGA